MGNWPNPHNPYNPDAGDTRDASGNRTGARPKVGPATGKSLRDAVQAATAPQGKPTTSPQPKTQANQNQSMGDTTSNDFAKGIKEMASPHAGMREQEIDSSVDSAAK